PVPITLDWCCVDGSICLLDAELPGLFLENTAAKEVDADRVRCPGSINLTDHTSINGPVRFGGARIGGDLDCAGAHFVNSTGDCLFCEGAEIQGTVFLGKQGRVAALHAVGGVDLFGGRIDGNFYCNGVRFVGEVWFIGAQIKGDLDFSRASFAHGIQPTELALSRADIGGRLFFRRVTGEAKSIIMRAATVGALVDDMPS